MREEEEFYAWLDGELDGEAAQRVAAEVAADPELQRLAAQHRAMRTRLRSAFDAVAAAPIPEALLAATSPSGEVSDLAAARARRERRSFRPIWRQAAALAATLALGMVSGSMLLAPTPGLVEQEGGHILARGQLEQALQTGLASAPAANEPRIGLTFRDRSGAICRSFDGAGATGLACREDGDWRIRGLFQASDIQRGDYRMAAGADPLLAALIEQEMSGEPFDARQEKAAKERSWR